MDVKKVTVVFWSTVMLEPAMQTVPALLEGILARCRAAVSRVMLRDLGSVSAIAL